MSDNPKQESQRARRWPWLVLAALLLIGAGGSYWLLSRPSDTDATAATNTPAPLIEVTDLTAVDAVILQQTGFIRAYDAVDVVPQITERIVHVAAAFTPGNFVAAEEVLIRLDATSAEANLQAARAGVAQAEAALNEAQITLERQQELLSEDVVSEAAFEDAQVALARAEADLAVAEAELYRAALALDDTVLRAPFDAIVTDEAASIGQFVQAGTRLGRLVAEDSVEIEMGVLQSDLAPTGGAIDLPGTPVAISDPATGQDLGEGRIEAVLPEIDVRTRTVGLLIRVPSPFDDGAPSLRLGQLVELAISLPVENGPALRVQAEALKGGDTLWQVSEGTLTRIPVEVLSRNGDIVRLRADGLTADDQVMLSDLAAPADGMAVRVADGAMQVAEGG